MSRLHYISSTVGQTFIHDRATESWPLMLQMTTTMAMATTTTMTTGVATTVTVMATSTTAAPLQRLLPLLQVVALQLQLLLARGTFLAMATLTTATTTTMTPAQHLLQPLPAVVMLLLLPRLHSQVTLSNTPLCCAGYQNAVVGVLFQGCYQHYHQGLYHQTAANNSVESAAC